MAATRKLAALATTAVVATSVAVISQAPAGATPVPSVEPPLPGVAFEAVGRYDTGDAVPDDEITAAEIVAYEDDTLYVMSASSVDVVDLSDPSNPVPEYELALPGDPTSIAVSDGLLAVAVPADPRTDPGRVIFFRGRTQVGSVVVGSLPDMVTFTPDGSLLAVANEGEPSSYGQPDSIDPEGSISVITVRPFRTPGILRGRGAPQPVTAIRFTDFNVGARRHAEIAGVRITGPGASVAQDLEPEYITIADDSRTAWVSLQENNAIARVDLRSKQVVSIAPLGLADHSVAGFGIDPSNEDGAIAIAPWGVKGMYMPDGIANFSAGGQRFVVTANEGDAREYTGHSDVGRARSVADPAIPGAATRSQLGQLNVSTASDVPRNGSRVSELRSFGSRSFTIRTAEGQIVWDSGDDFEQIVARTLPGSFNASNSNNSFDNRSDDKGPEPESVVVGEVDGRTLAFVGLERIGGVMVYDVTDPMAPVFQQYLVTRVFDGDDVGPDSGPEGMVFIAAGDSPTGQPLLVVGNEVTGTVNIFGAVAADPAGTLTLLHNNDGESTVEPLTAGLPSGDQLKVA
ncbi:MAG: choice-of-anchor I family protein, partial [Ilumatobacteraceae bacterium]|nr:choice-of-anchor I family protein [Ilumatobacteraceae bacterium]